jgi:hypothetical protein
MTDHGGSGAQPRDAMDALLKAIRTVAREDDAAIASFLGAGIALSEQARSRIAARILAQPVDRRSGPTLSDAGIRTGARIVELRPARRARPRRRTGFWAGAGVALAAAAAWALVVSTPPAGEGALPAYSVRAGGGVMELRGSAPVDDLAAARTAGAQHLLADSELRIACRPDSVVTGPVAARMFFVQSGSFEELHPTMEVAPTGAVALRIRGLELLAHHTGRGELRVVIGRPTAVGAISTALTGTDGQGYRWLFVPVSLGD